MARVELELPPSFLFTMDLPLRVSDMNYANHLGNDRVLGLAQEVRVAWLASHGLKELDVGGAGIILADAAVVYRAEGHQGMILEAALGVGEVRSRSVELFYRFVDRASKQELARVKTGVLCFDYSSRRVVALTDRLRAALGL
jgi:acyl-CoA thioester hydrolase